MSEKDYGAILTAEELAEYVKGIKERNQPFAFDIESGYDGPDGKDLAKMPFHPQWKLVGISFTDDPSWARYVPIDHDEGPNVPKVAAARLLWNLLQTGNGVPHNAMFELQGLGRFFRETLWDDTFYGAAVRKSQGLYPVRSDTMIEAAMMQCYPPLAKGQGVGIGLKGLVKHIWGHQMTEFMALFPEEDSELGPGTPKSKRSKVRFNSRRVCPQVIEYGCEDSAWTLALHLYHYDKVCDSLMFKAEIKLLPLLCEMELEGLCLDWDEYARQEQIISEFKEAFNEEIHQELSEKLGELVSVNFNAPQQVAELLYDKMKLPEQLDKKTKKRTTAEKAMLKLARETNDPTLIRILEFRAVSKLLSAYIVKYLKELRYDPSDRVRPSHKQLGAGTGRFSVDKVSYQQWPKPYSFKLKNGTTLRLNYRNFLIAPEGYRIVGFDFAQVEMRVLAGVVGEPAMLKAFEDGIDLHKQTASVMFNVPFDEVTDKQRQAAKGLNFGILYGQGASALADTLGITKAEAEELLYDYFAGFSKLRAWMDAQVALGRETGSVQTPFGRQFHIWNYDDSRQLQERALKMKPGDARDKLMGLARYVYSEGDRLCVNAAIQGGAADYLKLGMVRVRKAIHEAGLQDKIKLVMTIHDALEFYVHESVSTQEVIDLLNPMVSFPVPGFPEILAEWHEGKRWGEVVEVKVDKNKKIIGYEWAKQKFATIEEAYEAIENPPAPEPEPEPTPEEVVMIELDDLPNSDDWQEFKNYLFQNQGDGYPVWVRVQGAEKSLEVEIPGRESQLEELRFLLPYANIRLLAFEKAPF